MEQFKKVTKPLALDFYTISKIDGIKTIHIFGYSYESSNEEFVTDDNPNGIYWANIECCWFLEPLEEFIQNLRADYNYVDDTFSEVKQYQSDNTKEQMVDTINKYFQGKPADFYLPYEEITMDTPCGNYVVKGEE